MKLIPKNYKIFYFTTDVCHIFDESELICGEFYTENNTDIVIDLKIKKRKLKSKCLF